MSLVALGKAKCSPDLKVSPKAANSSAFAKSYTLISGEGLYMTKFRVHFNDDMYQLVSRKVFYEIINGAYGYLHYFEGGIHTALLPVKMNE